MSTAQLRKRSGFQGRLAYPPWSQQQAFTLKVDGWWRWNVPFRGRKAYVHGLLCQGGSVRFNFWWWFFIRLMMCCWMTFWMMCLFDSNVFLFNRFLYDNVRTIDHFGISLSKIRKLWEFAFHHFRSLWWQNRISWKIRIQVTSQAQEETSGDVVVEKEVRREITFQHASFWNPRSGLKNAGGLFWYQGILPTQL